MKGTKVLILSPTQMYVYLPAFGKVRRIASHTKDQGFLGLSFSQDDMATTAYAPLYSGAISSDSGAQTIVTLTPKAGVDAPYAEDRGHGQQGPQHHRAAQVLQRRRHQRQDRDAEQLHVRRRVHAR